MECPRCNKKLEKAIFHQTEVDYCPQCLGIFFEEDELRQAKDERDRGLRWLDIDLWKDKNKFKIAYGIRLCPFCRLPLYEIYYGDSRVGKEDKSSSSPTEALDEVKKRTKFSSPFAAARVIVDVCNVCKGIWLDRGEFKKIIEYLKEKGEYEILNDYLKTLAEEFWEIFTGPENLREEVLDFMAIFKIINYKFLVQYPQLANIISNLPK